MDTCQKPRCTFNVPLACLGLQVQRFPSQMEKIQIYKIQLNTCNNSNSIIHFNSILTDQNKISPKTKKEKKFNFKSIMSL